MSYVFVVSYLVVCYMILVTHYDNDHVLFPARVVLLTVALATDPGDPPGKRSALSDAALMASSAPSERPMARATDVYSTKDRTALSLPFPHQRTIQKYE